MILHKDSHLDHGFTPEQVEYIAKRFGETEENRDGFFIDTFELPEELGSVPCGLYGPIVGDDPIHKTCVAFAKRGERAYPSRILIGAGTRPTQTVTVIAGPHDEDSGSTQTHHDCILYTAFGGPLTPREVDDPTLPPEQREASVQFWKEHALAGENK